MSLAGGVNILLGVSLYVVASETDRPQLKQVATALFVAGWVLQWVALSSRQPEAAYTVFLGVAVAMVVGGAMLARRAADGHPVLGGEQVAMGVFVLGWVGVTLALVYRQPMQNAWLGLLAVATVGTGIMLAAGAERSTPPTSVLLGRVVFALGWVLFALAVAARQ